LVGHILRQFKHLIQSIELISSGRYKFTGQTFSQTLQELQLFLIKESLKIPILLNNPYISPRGQRFLQKNLKFTKHKIKIKIKIKVFR